MSWLSIHRELYNTIMELDELLSTKIGATRESLLHTADDPAPVNVVLTVEDR